MSAAADMDPPRPGVLTPGEPPTPPSQDQVDKADMERLGRQRPDLLRNWLGEAGFVFTIVFSMMMSEYFVG